MSEEEETRLPLDHQEFTSKRMEDMTPDEKLHAATQLGQGSLVKELLNQGSRVSVDQNGTTALHEAAQGGFADIVRILLDHRTDIDIADSGGYTALHKSAGKGHLDVLGLLINEGCDIDTQDDTYGNTPLHEAAWNGFSKSVDLLLRNKSNAFISNRAGCTALHLAAQSGHNQCGRALLYAGCSPDVKNNYGDTPLHTAARYGHAGTARILISARCSISEQNKNGDTALHIAAAFKRRKIAKLLVEGGINTQLTNKQGETATEIARRKDHLSIIEIIHSGHAEPTGGVRLNYSSDNCRTQSSSQFTASRETTPDNREKKKSTGLVSWIKRKFAKEKLEKERQSKAGVGMRASRSLDLDDGNLGLFSQYVKKQGFAYYRDLAGNIRQGPMGYVPNCHCESNKLSTGLNPQLDNKQTAFYDHMASTNHKLSERLRDLELETNRRVHEIDMAAKERLLLERQERLDRLRRHNSTHDKHTTSRQAENHLRGNLQSWLATQISEGRDSDPFGYTVGTKQQRFGDDFDHERIARYEAMNSEHFPLPPRLFRSRSDETLTHSEYSFHGRAFKSKEAAMEELKTLKHHEEIRERRKLIRAGINIESPPDVKGQHNTKTDESDAAKPHHRQNDKRMPGLWMSRDHLDDDRSRMDTGCDSHETINKECTAATSQRPPDHSDSSSRPTRVESFTRTPNVPRPERVIGRRESSASPERKPSIKATTSVPLKSAMRQPRPIERSADEKLSHVYRSNSLPRDSKVEFTAVNGTRNGLEPKKAVKTVRYDETVKSAEIAQDLPPSLSPAQAEEETLLPAKREAPIGGHDEKYSENGRPPAPPYHSVVMNHKPQPGDSSTDLRDSIVNARKELLARNKPETTRPTVDNRSTFRNNMIPRFESPQRANTNNTINQNGGYSATDRANRSSSGAQNSYYPSQEAVRQPQKQQTVPFSHYSNGHTNYNRHLSHPNAARGVAPPYSTSSLPRPHMSSSTGDQMGGPRRVPLPSYEEIIHSNRPIKVSPSQPSNYARLPPNYPMNKRNNQQANVVNDQSTRLSNGGNTNGSTKLQHRRSFHEVNNDPLTATESTSLGNHTDSCSSSNPDSGYNGNFYDNKTTTSPVDYNLWYQQNLQSTAMKMNAQHAMADSRSHVKYPPQPNSFYRNGAASSGPTLSVPKRTVYTNMTSDV